MTRTLSNSIATLLLALGIQGTAGAIVLDFEGLTSSSAEDITSNNQGYGGLTWNTGSNWVLWKTPDYPVPVVSGSYGLVNNFGLDPNFVSGAPFDFDGVHVVGWYFNAPTAVGVRGYDAGSNLVGDSGLVSISTSAYTFLNVHFANVTKVEFYGGQYFAIDDVIINQSSVPEPTSLALFALGLSGLLLISRRVRARP